MKLGTRRQLTMGGVLILALLAGVVSLRLFSPREHLVKEVKDLYYCPMHPTMTSDRPADCPICSMKMVKREPAKAKVEAKVPKEKKILYWTDPMMPGYKSNEPGKSPMGMDLVPVYEEEPKAPEGIPVEGYAPVQITTEKQQLMGVRTAAVEKRPLHKTIRTVGRIAYDPTLYQAQSEYLQAIQALSKAKEQADPLVVEQANRLVESARIRLRLLGLGEELIQEIEKQRGPDERLLLADSEGGVWIYATIYEFELPWIKVGDRLTVETPFIPGKRLVGNIRSIDPILDSTTRSARARAILKDPEKWLKPNMYVNAFLELDLGYVLAVSQEAVMDTGTRKMIFIDKGEGRFEPREVITGLKADGFTEIRQGLKEGERIVVSGNFLIDSESRLKGTLEAMATPPADSHEHSHAH